ncbi:MAG: AAA family ATPase [Deltaproteobacteria bacterium]|nr:AAA family ATPase [Deltaproteobacteria bacterium]
MVADFQTIRQKRYLYADYFLSRPRRLGKSLLVSTLKAILRQRPLG